METVDVLRRARDHIAQPGQWFQGDYSADESSPPLGAVAGMPCCAYGAIMWVLQKPDEHPRVLEADRFLYLALGGDCNATIDEWNDAPGRTQADVVALFDRAIALAEQSND